MHTNGVFFFLEVGKILFAENLVGEKRRERLHIGECRGTRKPVIPNAHKCIHTLQGKETWSKISHFALFFQIASWQQEFSDVLTWKLREFSLAFHLLCSHSGSNGGGKECGMY
jgi:hypothetical protein